MVDFGKKILEKRVDGWEEYYIDYGRLKSLIKNQIKLFIPNYYSGCINKKETGKAPLCKLNR